MAGEGPQTPVFELTAAPPLNLCTSVLTDTQGMMPIGLDGKGNNDHIVHQGGMEPVTTEEMNHVTVSDGLIEHDVDGSMVQIVGAPVENIVDNGMGQMVSGTISQLVEREITPGIGGVIGQITNGVTNIIKKEEDVENEAEEEGLDADPDTTLLDDDEEDEDEIQVKQEKGRKTKGRKRRKRRLTFTPRKLNKIYQCEHCPARFARDTQLKYHSKVHIDDQTEGPLSSVYHFMACKGTKLLERSWT